MSSCYCSSSGFLQSHHTVLLSSFFVPFSCTFWCCSSFPCISQILEVPTFSFSGLSVRRTNQEYLQWPLVSSSDNVCRGSHWLFKSLLRWRWWPPNPCLYDGDRLKLPAYHSVIGFQHVGIFQLFEVKLGLLIPLRWSWKIIISKSLLLPMSAPGKLRVLAMVIPDRKRFLTKM